MQQCMSAEISTRSPSGWVFCTLQAYLDVCAASIQGSSHNDEHQIAADVLQQHEVSLLDNGA